MERRGIRKDIKNNIYRKRIEKVEEWVDDRSVLDETSAKNEAGGEKSQRSSSMNHPSHPITLTTRAALRESSAIVRDSKAAW